ncbi:MAG: alpha/beta hydrolase [Clostridia bacterium]|nr:alpha/beta hydrolase [Clostridia bacterium]
MAHSEYVRMVDGAKRAVIFIHGIVGKAEFYNEYYKLVPNDVSIYGVLLDGHGKEVKDFSRTSMKKWEKQVEKIVNDLSKTHDEIYMVGHSMGTLFSIEQATKNPKVKGIFLMASPVKVFITPKLVKTILRVYLGKIREDRPVEAATRNYYGSSPNKNLFAYIPWIFRILELFKKIRQTRRILKKLETPTYIYQSVKDEVVSNKSIRYFRKRVPFPVYALVKSGHCYYEPSEQEFLYQEFKNFIEEKALN